MSYKPVPRRTTTEGLTANDEFHLQGKRGKTFLLPVDSIEDARVARDYYGKDKVCIFYSDAHCGLIVVGKQEAIALEAYGRGRIRE